jgi:hypothetical protein
MSDEQRKDDEAEVEAHRTGHANEEPREAGTEDDEVEAHRVSAFRPGVQRPDTSR